MRRLTREQMESDNGRIYGRAPVPGAQFEVNGVFYDTRGYECVLPGAKREEPKVEPEPEPEKELTESEVRIQQVKDFLASRVDADDRDEIVKWAEANIDGFKIHPAAKLATVKEKVLEAYIAQETGEKEAA